MNIPFLHQVARHYLDAPNLEDYCFVFPNRRSGQFFVHYLTQDLIDNDHKSSSIKPHLLPRVTSINDLVSELTNTVTATDIEMMFALYDAYCQAFGDNAQEFDKFIYWAQLIIGDFNDLDKSLNDAYAIFKHLDEIARMGATVRIMNRTAIIDGVPQLYGAPVTVTDLRAGAALIVAGLMASGMTEIYELEYIDRGYEHLEDKLRSLGAQIVREPAD